MFINNQLQNNPEKGLCKAFAGNFQKIVLGFYRNINCHQMVRSMLYKIKYILIFLMNFSNRIKKNYNFTDYKNQNNFIMKTPLIFLMLCVSFLCSSLLNAQTDVMNKEVGENLQSWLQKIPPGQENIYGFQNRDEFTVCELGDPYAVYTLNSDFFRDKTSINYLKQTSEWRVPVVVSNQDRALLTVIQENGTFEIVDLGATILARELQGIRNSQKPGKESPKILRIFQLQSDFLLLDDPALPADEIRVIPLHSAYLNLEKLNSSKKEIWKLSSILNMVRENLPENNVNY